MADSYIPDSEPTTRTLLRHVLDTADTCSPQRRRSARAHAQRVLSETPSLRRRSSQTKMTVRRSSRRTRSAGRLTHIQVGGQLEEQTPRTLMKNILLTAPESSTVMPEPVVEPISAPQMVQPSRRESSRGSPELQLPELEPTTVLAPGLLVPGRKKRRLRLSVFQQGMDQGLPLSQASHGNANASSLTSSLSLTFATPLQPQSVQRPGLARRPLTRRAVDMGVFLQDLRDTSVALVPSGDSLRTPVAALPIDMVLEDTQPFSQPLAGCSPSVSHSLSCPSLMGAKGAERPVSHRTRYSLPGLQNNGAGEPAHLLAGKAEVADALATGFPNTSSSVSGEDGVAPSQDGVGEEAEERMGGSLTVNKAKEATVAQESLGAEEHERHTDVTEAEGSWGPVNTKESEGSLGNEDTTGRAATPEVVSSITPESFQTKQRFPEPAALPGAASPSLPSEPLEPARLLPKARIPGPRLRQDPYKTGLRHYAKLFSFYAKMPLEKAAVEMVEKCLDKYFQNLCDDLDVFAAHAGRKTVRPEDVELLMRRQGLVTDQVSLHVLVERHLPLEYRQLLIPCAFSGNSVFPAQ